MGPCVSKDRRRRGQPASELEIIERRPQPRPRPTPGLTRSSPASEPAAESSRQTLDTVRLHNLPIVLQEKILLHSLEPCMARALANSSVSRGKELSNDTIYRVFILLAFFDNEPPFPVRESHFEPTSYQFLTKAQRRRLQSDIVECKWFTVELLQKQVPTLVQLALEREGRLHRQAEETRGNDLSSLPDVDNVKELIEHYLDGYHSKSSRGCGLLNITLALSTSEDIVRRSMGPGKHVRKSVVFLCVPSRVLDPILWTVKAQEDLCFVRFRVEPESGIDANALYKGWNKAVREKQEIVCKRLVNLRSVVSGYWENTERERGMNPWYTSIHSGEYYKPPADHNTPVRLYMFE